MPYTSSFHVNRREHDVSTIKWTDIGGLLSHQQNCKTSTQLQSRETKCDRYHMRGSRPSIDDDN